MNYRAYIYTLALLGALALAAISGGLLPPSGNVAHADHIVAPANEAPEFPAGSITLDVLEDTPPGANIGSPVLATDDDGDTLTYSLEARVDTDDARAEAASFDIDPSTGQLITKAALDEETKASYSVTVKAEDGNDGNDTILVTINVTDVDEDPSAPARRL